MAAVAIGPPRPRTRYGPPSTGSPAAGKTTPADELAVVLHVQGREVIRATIEGFLFPRAQRRRGEYCMRAATDSHDHDAMRRDLLDPLRPEGDRRFRTAVYHRETDTALSLPAAIAPADAVLLFDGVFLLRPELIDRWDLSIVVSVPFERTLDRAQARGNALAGLTPSPTTIERAWRERYPLPAPLLRSGPPGRPLRHHRQQLRAPAARLGSQATPASTQDLTWTSRRPGRANPRPGGSSPTTGRGCPISTELARPDSASRGYTGSFEIPVPHCLS